MHKLLILEYDHNQNMISKPGQESFFSIIDTSFKKTAKYKPIAM